MKRKWLKRGLMMCLSVINTNIAIAQGVDDLQVSQSLPDIAPLLNALRNVQEPEIKNGRLKLKNEQITREIEQLKESALSYPKSDQERIMAGQASCLLGLLYLHGAAVQADASRAKQWFSLCAHHGEPIASAGLAWCAFDGCQSAPNLLQAQAWTNQLSKTDPPRAAHLRWLIAMQLRPVRPNSAEGLDSLRPTELSLLTNSASGGNVHALIELGIIHAQSHDLMRALEFFERASLLSRIAMENASWVRKRIESQSEDRLISPENGPSLYAPPQLSSSEQTTKHSPGHVFSVDQGQASYLAARRSHRGDGVPLNYSEAIRLYQYADAQGNVHAKRMLSLIYSRTTPEGGFDAVWMRQLGDLDVNAPVPKQDVVLGASELRREITPLIDLLPNKWRQWID